jgi:ATP/maltotriose-dependent transcriptional regulator MalT
VTPTLVPRTRPIELLNASLARPLTLVCAATGFGKTTRLLIPTFIDELVTLPGDFILVLDDQHNRGEP